MVNYGDLFFSGEVMEVTTVGDPGPSLPHMDKMYGVRNKITTHYEASFSSLNTANSYAMQHEEALKDFAEINASTKREGRAPTSTDFLNSARDEAVDEELANYMLSALEKEKEGGGTIQ